jgi:hypothetical protein
VKEERSTNRVVQHVQTRVQVLAIKIQFAPWPASKVVIVLREQLNTMDNVYNKKIVRASLMEKSIIPLHLS